MKEKKNEGITLIALVITIIVLLILAGVTLSTLFGNNGILTQSQEAVLATKEANAREDVQMAWTACETEYEAAWAKDSSVVKKDYFTTEKMNQNIGSGTVDQVNYNENGSSIVVYKKDEQTYTFTMDTAGSLTTMQSESWIEVADTNWYDTNPEATEFTISNAYELAGVAKLVNEGNTDVLGKTIKLGNDINLSGRKWIAIGTDEHPYYGTFDGQNYSISHMDVKEGGGLFGYAEAGQSIDNEYYYNDVELKNIIVRNSNIVSDGDCGAIIRSVNSDGYCTIENCKSLENYICSNKRLAGGIVGGFSSTTPDNSINNCYNTSFVESKDPGTTGDSGAGGIIGEPSVIPIFENNKVIKDKENQWRIGIINCLNEGEIKSSDNQHAGGICAVIIDFPGAEFERCVNRGKVSGKHVGGIIGTGQCAYGISSCYNIGELNSSNGDKGGIVGHLGDTTPISKSFCREDKVGNFYTQDSPDYVEGDPVFDITQIDVKTSVTDEFLKSDEAVTYLGSGFKKGDQYPLLSWE